MIATVTLNPALDKTLLVPGFAVGGTNRGRLQRVDPGGKGINVAKALRQLGHPVLALGFVAGLNGEFLRRALADLGIAHDFVETAGETRVNLKIEDPLSGTETELNEAGSPVSQQNLQQMERRVGHHAAAASVVVFSGSLPPGAPAETYARLIHIARDRGAKTVLDASGTALREGLAARPELAKLNRVEAEELLGTGCDPEAALGRIQALGAAQVVISLGAEGAVAAFGRQRYRVESPRIEPRCTIGAGDAMVAALAAGLAGSIEFSQALRLAAAAGAATAACDGTSVATRREIDAVLERVGIREVL